MDITDYRDKIVQKGITLILEQLTEHRFLESSFGFPHGRSAHDALYYIRKKIHSGMWAIEGDISKCFDRFNHKRIVSVIRKKYVTLQVFTDLLYKALKSNIVVLNHSLIHKTSTTESSLLNSLLYNIYLHELDLFITEGKELAIFRNKTKATTNPEFISRIKLTKAELNVAKVIKREKSKKKYWKHLQQLRVTKLKALNKENILRVKHKGLNIHIAYVRHINDFIIFVWGTKNDCIEIRKRVKNFLKSNLELNLNLDKTHITHLKKNKANFLGFQLWQSPTKLYSTKKNVNVVIDRNRINSKLKRASMQTPRLRITFSMKSILRKLVDKGLVCYKTDKFFPTSYKSVLQYDIPNIVNYLALIFRSLANYYSQANNWYNAKSLYNYFGKFCTAMTIAHKTKSKVSKVFKKYGDKLEIKDGSNKKIASYGVLTNRSFKKNLTEYRNGLTVTNNIENLLMQHLNVVKNKIITEPNVIYSAPAEIHHIKNVHKV
jgi:retron-type reverse transcriptase